MNICSIIYVTLFSIFIYLNVNLFLNTENAKQQKKKEEEKFKKYK